MSFLQRRGPILMFVFVLGMCALLISSQYVAPKVREDVNAVYAGRDRIEQALSDGVVASEYTYSAEHAARIDSHKTLLQHAARAKRAPENSIGTFVSYPQPMRPSVVAPADEPTVEQHFAVLGELSSVKAVAVQGRVYFTCDLPDSNLLQMMDLVRIEIFRGRFGENFDTSKPFGVIELGLEELSTEKAKPQPAPAERERKRGPQEKIPPAPFKLPERQRVFRDTQVEHLQEYAYAARLVARFTSSEGARETVTAADGTKKYFVHRAPQNAMPVVPANLASKSKLYATPLTPVVRAKTPLNFELRLSGINGTVPGKARAPNQVRTGYTANFELRVWINELQDWKYAQITEVAEGQNLGGKLAYRAKNAGESTVYDFTRDLGMTLLEVNQEDVETELAGAKVTIKTEVALIENQKTKELKKYIKTARKAQEETNPLDRIVAEQEKAIQRLRQ